MRRSKSSNGLLNGVALKTRSLEHALQVSFDGKWSHVRRCHKCGHVTESTGERVLSCDSCATHFAPFFFAELTPEAIVEAVKTQSRDMSIANTASPTSLAFSTARNYRAVVGLTWWWSDAD